MKVLIADDHAILRDGLCSLILHDLKMDVVGAVSNGQEVIAAADKLKPDLIIMDIEMPELDGIQATAIIKDKHPRIKIIILSMHTRMSYVKKALQAGALGFVQKEQAFDELAKAIDDVKRNNRYLSEPLKRMVIDDYVQFITDDRPFQLYRKLTTREKEVFNYMIRGSDRNTIAEALSVTVKTIDQHKANIKEKLELKNQEDIVDVAKRLGLI